MNGDGRPAMTMAEMRRGLRDQDQGDHWSYGRCWCEEQHLQHVPAAGLRMVPPPWAPARTRTGAAA